MPASTQEIRFHINGKEHVVPKFSPPTTLNDYLRQTAGLKGTKVMCREAGCGTCAVTVSHVSPDSDTVDTYSVQSCLTPLYTVDGWQITTVEGIGSQRDGFHPIQDRLAKFSGTQCGYCTPGMVMNMYGLLHQQPNITAQEIEDNFDGNMCRCTGYRPILDAMKSFAHGSGIPGAKAIDIEDLNKKLCPRTGEVCKGEQEGRGGTKSLEVEVNGTRWYRPTSLEELGTILRAQKDKKVKLIFGNTAAGRPTSLEELGTILRAQKDKKVKLIFGNTAAGIFKNEGHFDVYVDLHRVKYIFSYQVNGDSVRLGAATSLTSMMNKLKANQNKPGFRYFSAIVRHLKVIANVMVRNSGCIAGNLMIKHAHPDFPSDVFTFLEAAGAKVEIYDSVTSKFSSCPLVEFLREVNMAGSVLTAVTLPKLEDNVVFQSFKITPRWQNAHAYVNAAFKIAAENRTIKGRPSLVYGGINAETVHATNTENFLENRTLSAAVVKEALDILREELQPEYDQTLASPKYRRELSGSLLYKVLLGIYKPDDPRLRSGPDHLHRPISSGLQTYQEIKTEFPLKEAMPKVTAPLQASGEAQFVNDIPTFQQELFGAYVLSDQASAMLDATDASEALKIPGVVAFLTAKDIPEGGTNNYLTSFGMHQFQQHQEIFASKEISFAGQPVGMIVAETQSLANAAAQKVKMTYSDIQTPILSVEESIAAGREYPFPQSEKIVGEPDEAWKSVEHTIEGECRMGSQYHYYLETQVSLAVPSEDGIDVYTACQFPSMNHIIAAEVIGKPLNFINMTVPRVGGAFGGKLMDACSVTGAATLAAYVLGRPVRVSLDMSTNVRMCGKRAANLARYKAGFSASGDLQVVDLDFYLDCGYTPNSAPELIHIVAYIDMAYYIPHWKIRSHPMFSNKQTCSPVRAPGSVPAAFVIESIMEHVAKVLNKHPVMVKELNLYEQHQTDLHGHAMTHCTIREVWRRLKDTAEVEGRIRQVDAFNQENLWKKRGITMTSVKYGVAYFGNGFTANVSIFAQDGSILVSQGGVEMGQGLYTKLAQGVAHSLGVPIDKVKVRPTQNIISPNNWGSGGSVSSELATQSAIGACNILKERIQPIREKFPDLDWKDLCGKCITSNVDLSAKYTNTENIGDPLFNYFIYCAAVIETEVDILTGESQIRRVDMMCDFGESLNPTVDIGQVEGAFVMGLGCYLSEDILFDGTTGRILNDGTWEYKPPTTKDIPIDWRIHLLPDTPNPVGIRSSKATGEPPICLSVGALLANKLAINSARKDLFDADDYIPSVAPFTVERAQQSVGLTTENFIV
ncbi:indole-3-acetaldehyde oxidase [Aplysia californica]|uniref:Indole-3-acetaldehyde oxidase n=1 Tax=Aplysia californica TaxID=6500 RepID=A0ABM1VV33_APLCA|nr:indole-3-acetaldehyde oxidase [Aplysia californica]